MYTIQILKGGVAKRNRVLSYLLMRMAKEGKFTANVFHATDKRLPSIHIKLVRLTKAKPYCGQHPGECLINPFFGPQKKQVNKYLEWEDWIKFHAFVNRVLNRFRTHADVWSNPPDAKGKMWIRKGVKPRINWDWTDTWVSGQRVQLWNQGTIDQFMSGANP